MKHTPVSSRAETLPCRTADPELWFSERPADVADAKARCQACPIMAACLDGATRRREPYGVWGGELFLAGTPTQRGYRRDRPEGRTCGHCGDPIPDRLRADAEVCSKSCREARARARIAARRAAGEAA